MSSIEKEFEKAMKNFISESIAKDLTEMKNRIKVLEKEVAKLSPKKKPASTKKTKTN